MWDRFGGSTRQSRRQSITRRPREDEENPEGQNPATEETPAGGETTTPQPQYEEYGDIFQGGGGETPTSTGVIQPQQWLDANTLYGQAGNLYGQMARTGMPTSASNWYQNAKGQAKTDIYDIIKQINEQQGASGYGKRYSTATARQGMDAASRRMGELGTQFAGMEMGSEEAARNRQLQAMGGLLNTAGGYQGLGNQMTQYPLQLADRAAQYGAGLYGVGQNQANALQQYWQGQQSYSNPWLQYGMGMATQQLPMTYPQYDQSGFGQLLGAAGSFLPYLFM